MNAFTSKEYTCFYARVLDTDLPLAVDVVCDLVTSSVIRGADVDSERGVILEEIAMHEDDPTDMVHDQFAQVVFGDSRLGRPVLGTVESIETIGRSAIAGYYRRRYRPQDMVVAVAGNVDHAAVVRLVKKAFDGPGLLDGTSPPTAPRAGERNPRTESGVRVVRRTTEQANVVLGGVGVSRTDERRFALGVLNAALGGGMSSRLFQEVREKRGLAYSVYSYHAQYADTGLFGVYAGCVPRKVDDVLAICRDELDKVGDVRHHARRARARQGTAAGLAGARPRGHRLADEPHRQGRARLRRAALVDQVLARIDDVTLDDVAAVASDLAAVRPTLAVVGPVRRGPRLQRRRRLTRPTPLGDHARVVVGRRVPATTRA